MIQTVMKLLNHQRHLAVKYQPVVIQVQAKTALEMDQTTLKLVYDLLNVSLVQMIQIVKKVKKAQWFSLL